MKKSHSKIWIILKFILSYCLKHLTKTFCNLEQFSHYKCMIDSILHKRITQKPKKLCGASPSCGICDPTENELINLQSSESLEFISLYIAECGTHLTDDARGRHSHSRRKELNPQNNSNTFVFISIAVSDQLAV